MASISSLMGSSSSTSSIYGNRNIISGLASGMDTELMIENCVKGYQAKIKSLQQQQTKVTWKQDAFRSITDKLISLSQKYTSYTSKTNLSSPSFFLNAVNTVTNGSNAQKVSATGRTNSEIKINAVKQLASAARYSVEATDMKTKDMAIGSAVDFDKRVELTNISGDITLMVGREKISLSFADDEIIKNADELTAAINKKLGEQEVGKNKGDELVRAVNNGGTISFETIGEAKAGGDAVWISSAYGDIKDTLGITAGALGKGDTSLNVGGGDLYRSLDRKEYLSGQVVNIEMGGKTARVVLGDLTKCKDSKEVKEKITESLQNQADKVFGKVDGKSKVSISFNKDGSLTVDPLDDKTEVKVTSAAGAALGFGSSNTLSNTVDTNSTLLQVLGNDLNDLRSDITVSQGSVRPGKDATTGVDTKDNKVKKEGDAWYRVDDAGNKVEDDDGNFIKVDADDVRVSTDAVTGVDRDGNTVAKKDGVWYRVDKDGNNVRSEPNFDIVINDVKIGSFDKNTTISEILSKINSSEAGVKASYSKLTNKFVFTANETGSEGRVDIGGTLGEKLFGKTKVGEADVYTNDSGIVTDSDGKALAAGEDEFGKYYLKAVTVDGNTKYFKAELSGSFITDDNMNAIEVIPSNDKDAANALGQARKGFEVGKDAIINATVNGDNVTLTRSSNVIDMDGMSVTISDTFNNDKDANGVSFFDENGNWNKNAKVEADSIVTFTTKTDSDKIIESVQEFIKEFNELATQVRSEYSTTPLKNSNKKNYEPLTDEDKEDMSESQIKAYEEKAKTGLLFGDTDLSGLHNALRSVITPSGDVRGAMTEIGLTTKYENGVTTLSLDENKFRAALEKDPDAVQKVFTANKENGDSYDGLMARTKKAVDAYASTSIGNYGILVNKAGTKSKSLTLMSNTLQKKYNSLEEQIERWQTKMSDKVDYYTRQFTQLEKLMNEMNSQSSALAGMMGGY